MNTNTYYKRQTIPREYSKPNTIEYGFFEKSQLQIIQYLVKKRLPLPAFFGDYWRCSQCSFETRTIHQIAEHIIVSHEPAKTEGEQVI